jgi:hypothetical protein
MNARAIDKHWLVQDDAEVLARVVELELTVIEIREMVSTLEALAADVLASRVLSEGPHLPFWCVCSHA